jgi:hypothetical protein
MSITRTPSNLAGSPGSPSTIVAGGTLPGTLDLTAVDGTMGAAITARVNATPTPTVFPRVLWSYSLDGTQFFPEEGPLDGAQPDSMGNFNFGPYVPPAAALKARATIYNFDKASIAGYIQASVMSSSTL